MVDIEIIVPKISSVEYPWNIKKNEDAIGSAIAHFALDDFYYRPKRRINLAQCIWRPC